MKKKEKVERDKTTHPYPSGVVGGDEGEVYVLLTCC